MNQTLLALLLYKCSVCEDYSMEKTCFIAIIFQVVCFFYLIKYHSD